MHQIMSHSILKFIYPVQLFGKVSKNLKNLRENIFPFSNFQLFKVTLTGPGSLFPSLSTANLHGQWVFSLRQCTPMVIFHHLTSLFPKLNPSLPHLWPYSTIHTPHCDIYQTILQLHMMRLFPQRVQSFWEQGHTSHLLSRAPSRMPGT